MPNEHEHYLRARGLTKRFPVAFDAIGRPTSWLSALNAVDLDVARGETFALVGETGSGKSTLAQTIARLLEPDAGSITLDGVDVLGARGRALASLRRRVQIVFQDPYSSLDPRMRIDAIVAEGLFELRGAALRARVAELLDLVDLSPGVADRYPHMLSGGQRQRVALARALAVEPELLVLDEPVSALDVSVQSQILNLLRRLSEQFGLTYVFITHDLGVVRYIADRVGVMYLGGLVEVAPTERLFEEARHPYTVALLSAIPGWRRSGRGRRIVLHGESPGAVDPPDACRFAPRCPRALDVCVAAPPPLVEDDEHASACFNPVPRVPVA